MSPITPSPIVAPAAEVLLARPRGFCAGVVRAIEIVERALELHGAPVYVFHEIVHNGHVVADLRDKGAVFVDSLDQVPKGAVTVFSAHGVSLEVVRQSQSRKLQVIDATCPLVTKVHLQAQRYAKTGYTIIVIGHAGHEEVVGTMGRIETAVHLVSEVADVAALPLAPDAPVAYVTQTTLSLDDTREIIAALKARFTRIVGPETDDICYATQNRQNAVRELAAQVDLVLVVGARNSSNSARLREVAAQQGRTAHLVQDESGIDPAWVAGARRIGVTAGASTPEVLVQRVAQRLRELGAAHVRQADGADEGIVFRLPVALLRPAA
jgi:4-hydroxy-3-methylbut-2-en-1-yl diphosphate reductase